MTQSDPRAPNLAEGLRADLADAGRLLAGFAAGPARDAADALSDAFAKAGANIARSLAAAALDGEVSVKRLAKSILEELAKAALPGLLDRIGLPAPSGAPVPVPGGDGKGAGGLSFAGAVAPVAITIHVAPGSDAEGFLRHRGQIAAELARAVRFGSRNL